MKHTQDIETIAQRNTETAHKAAITQLPIDTLGTSSRNLTWKRKKKHQTPGNSISLETPLVLFIYGMQSIPSKQNT